MAGDKIRIHNILTAARVNELFFNVTRKKLLPPCELVILQIFYNAHIFSVRLLAEKISTFG